MNRLRWLEKVIATGHQDGWERGRDGKEADHTCVQQAALGTQCIYTRTAFCKLGSSVLLHVSTWPANTYIC